MAIGSVFGRLKSHANQWGWKRTLYRIILRRAARYLGFHVHVVRVRTMDAHPHYPVLPPEIAFRVVSADELLQASEDVELNLDSDFVRDSIARGDIAYGAFDGPALIAYVWSASSSAPHTDKLWVRVDRPYVYSYNSYVRPDYRGQRIGPAIHLFMDSELCKQGRTHRAGFVSHINFESLAMGKHTGSVAMGHAGYITACGRALAFRTRSAKKIGFKFYEPVLADK